MLTFVTVGTFQFDQLVQTVLSEAVLGALRERGYTELVVQCGKSDFELAGAVVGGNTVTLERNGVRVELWRSRESLDAEYRRADLVIGHAGAGTILEVLRLGKPLIVVPNPTLLHNHQTELAGALAPYLRTSSIHDLADTIASSDPGATQKFPSFDGSRFRALVDSEMVTATAVAADAPDTYEEKHVHQIYDSIASHFSSTRYKPWPIIAAFLANLRDGWVGLDSGTGNGKYLPLPADRPGRVWTIGLDRSRNLLDIARTAGGTGAFREVVWGDVLGHSWREGIFDYAISIATIHHLATHERRKLAVKRLLSAVSPAHGRVLVYVWAVRQDELSKRSIPGGSSGTGQDVFVPWVMSEDKTQVFNRYYHMFDDGELAGLVTLAAEELGLAVGRPSTCSLKGVEIVQDGWERSNHYVELRRWQTEL